MKITDILSSDMVVADLKGTTKPDILNELAKALAAKYKEIKLTDLTAVLAERERLGSTASRRKYFSCWSRRKIPRACISRHSRVSRDFSRRALFEAACSPLKTV